MDNVLCDGSEVELAQCRFDGWASNDCESSEAAGVVCRNKTNTAAAKVRVYDTKTTPLPPLSKQPLHHKHHHHRTPSRHPYASNTPQFRLAGGRVPTEGRVEVRLNADASWGCLCGDGWSLLEANVLCKSLGLGYANDALQTDFFSGDNENDPPRQHSIAVSGTECFGNETSLSDCLHHTRVVCPGAVLSAHRQTSGGRYHRHSHVAAVMCVDAMPDLVFQHVELEQSAHLEDRPLYWLQCAMEENCLASPAYAVQRDNPNWRHESRRLLKFTASVLNAGTADFRPSIPKHLWEWHMCHM